VWFESAGNFFYSSQTFLGSVYNQDSSELDRKDIHHPQREMLPIKLTSWFLKENIPDTST